MGDFRRWRWISAGVGFLGAFFLFIGQGQEGLAFGLGVLLLVAAVLISVIKSRCPSCGHLIGRLSIFAQYCPYCGESLED